MGKYETEVKPCDICGGTEFEELHVTKNNGTSPVIVDVDTPIQVRDVMCMGCGLVQKSPNMTKESLDKFYEEDYSRIFRPGWDETISRSMVVYTLNSAVMACDWLKRKIRGGLSGQKIIDIGAGDGMFLNCLRVEGADVCGLEMDKRSIEIAWKLLGTYIHYGDYMEDPGVTGKFDIVVLRNSLEHMYSPTKALEKAKELLEDDGLILIEVPSAGKPYAAGSVASFLSGAHNYTFSVESLYELAKKVGLYIQSVEYAGHNSCMLALLGTRPSDIIVDNNPKELLPLLKERYKEVNKTFFALREIIKELFDTTNVNNSIERIMSYKHTSNLLVYMIVTAAIGDPNQRQLLAAIFDTYVWDKTQAEDINCCEASYVYLKGMFYRELGDFTMSKQYLDAAMDLYPSIITRNFVKELILEGVLSESVFGDYLWYSCYKASKNL